MTLNRDSIAVLRYNRIKILQKLVINRLDSFPPHFKTNHAFNLGLILSKSENIVDYLQEINFRDPSFEEKQNFICIDKVFKEIIGIDLNLDCLDKNIAVLSD